MNWLDPRIVQLAMANERKEVLEKELAALDDEDVSVSNIVFIDLTAICSQFSTRKGPVLCSVSIS